MNYFITILFSIVGFLAFLFLISLLVGKVLIRKGQKEFNEKALGEEGGKFIINNEGRRVEYFVYGNTDKDAPVVINIHGSGMEALFEKGLYENTCNELQVKGIAISLPGMGYTDMKIGRTVIDWVQEDLEPILKKEHVGDFYITGHSQGTPHAMATAYHCKERCKGMGLNAPLLPIDVSKDIGIETALGSESLPDTDQMKKPLMSWYFVLMHIFLSWSWLAITYLVKSTPKLKEEIKLLQRIKKSNKRSVIRGAIGNTWETALDVCYYWGFDPRLIETKNIVIWHAKDDAQCQPAIGAWLADHYAKDGATVNFKDKIEGYGHFTYCRGEYLHPKNSMIQALIQSL